MIAPVRLDAAAMVLAGGRAIIGGDPPRAVVLSDRGAHALRMLRGAERPNGGREAPGTVVGSVDVLGRRLVAAGLAHRRPDPVSTLGVVVVVPVRDRAVELDRCLAAVGDARTLVVDDGSVDAPAVTAVCRAHGAELVRRELPGGPAAARNTALEALDAELIAFLDSDCIPEPGWLELLAGVLADPRVGAVAPRVRPFASATRRGNGGHGAIGRFAFARCPLDLGPAPARVRPGARVSYVPSAALLVRRAAMPADGFDPALRYGEDVDLVWRLHDAGWQVRYEPAAIVRHAEPESRRELLLRRFRYGTSAGPLARRHPARLAPVIVSLGPATVIATALGGRRRLLLLAAGAHIGMSARRLRKLHVGVPTSAVFAARSIAWTTETWGRTATMLAAPVLIAVVVTSRRRRAAATALLVISPLAEWARRRPDLDPVRWTAMSIADDAAYGAGVWIGALRARTMRPLLPRRRGGA